MAKWADFLISAVRFGDARQQVDLVKIHQDMGSQISQGHPVSRRDVISLLNARYSHRTIFKNRAGKWTPGQKVGLVEIDGVEYIKTMADQSKADNLDDLPEC